MPAPNDSILYDRVKRVFDSYNVPPSVWYPIALAESGFNPRAMGDNGDSIGLFQLNTRGGQSSRYDPTQLIDPILNASIAAPAIVFAFDNVRDHYPQNEWAAQVARRSGHPGGSITKPFAENDPRIQRIRSLSQQFIRQFPTQQVETPAVSALNPLSAAQSFFKTINNFLKTFDALGWGIAALGILLVLISLVLLAAESKPIKTAGKVAVKVATKI